MLALFRVASVGRASSAQEVAQDRGEDHEAAFRRRGGNAAACASRLFWPIGCVRPVFADQRVNAGGIPWRLQPKRFDIGLAGD